MSREIKFRGYDEDKKRWVYGYYTKLIEGVRKFDAIISEENGELVRYYIHKKETISQYTSLKDKNGKEIYEGDIVKYYQPYSKRVDTHIVAWDYSLACFGLFEKDNKWCKEGDWLKIEDIEIIGNIHQDKELLND